MLSDFRAVLECLPAMFDRRVQDVLDAVSPVARLRASHRTMTPSTEGHRATAYIAPGTEMERTIAAIWGEAFQTEKIGVRENFFDLGGHSLLMVQVHGKLEAVLKRSLPITKMFQYPTIGALARHLSDEQIDPTVAQKIRERARQQKEALARQRQLSRK
jgi:acyl carrier protein